MRDDDNARDRDADLGDRIERDFDREPTLRRQPRRPSREEFRLRSLMLGFRPAAPDTSGDS